jgi:carbon-monoxide dehydrogenase large subunit
MPAVMNAIMDALTSVGVCDLDMPATGDRVWSAIRDAARSRSLQ